MKATDKIKCLFNKKHSCKAIRQDWEIYSSNILANLSESELIINDAWRKILDSEPEAVPNIKFNRINCDYIPKCYLTVCDVQSSIYDEIIEINKRIKNLNAKIKIIETYYAMNITHKKVHIFTAKDGNLYFIGHQLVDKDIEVQCKDQNGKLAGSANMELEIDGKAHLSTLDALKQQIGIGTQLFQYCESIVKELDDYMPTLRFYHNIYGQPIKVLYGGMVHEREYLKQFYRKCGCDISGWSFKKNLY